MVQLIVAKEEWPIPDVILGTGFGLVLASSTPGTTAVKDLAAEVGAAGQRTFWVVSASPCASRNSIHLFFPPSLKWLRVKKALKYF